MNIGKPLKHPSLHLLYILAGIEFGRDNDVMFDLRDHVANLDFFNKDADSHLAAMLVQTFPGHPIKIFIRHQVVLKRFRIRFRKPFNELVAILLQGKHLVDFKQAYELCGHWDLEFGFDKRPKSDFVMRTLARELKWKVPKCKWLGWDLKSLASWEYRRPSLLELAVGVKAQMETLCGKYPDRP